jgi:hypothetical protein
MSQQQQQQQQQQQPPPPSEAFDQNRMASMNTDGTITADADADADAVDQDSKPSNNNINEPSSISATLHKAESFQEMIFNNIMNDVDAANTTKSNSLPLGVPSDDDDDVDVEEAGNGGRGGRRGTDQFHSLPSADELKVSIASSGGGSIDGDFCLADSITNGNGGANGEIDDQGGGDSGGGSDGIMINGNDDGTNIKTSSSSKKRARACSVCGMYTLLIGFVIVVVVGLVLGLSLGLTQKNSSSETTYHGGEDRLDEMINYLIQHGVSSSEDLLDSTRRSPQFQAVDWLANDDDLQIGIPTAGNDLTSKVGYDLIVRYTLAVFYYTTLGSRWKYDLGFLSSKPTCQWYQTFAPPIGQVGVLCNQITQEIVGLSLGR